MIRKVKGCLQLVGLLLIFIIPPRSFASSRTGVKGVDGFNPTFYLDITGGFTTYKSQMVVQNDTSNQITYTLGGNAGTNRQYGFFVKTDSNTTTFEINSSSIQTDWRDSGLRYRLDFFYIGIVFSQIEMIANSAGTDTLDASGTGIGGNAGLHIPISRAGTFYLDITSVTPANPRNALTQEVTYGSRTDIDIGAGLDITKSTFDFLLGYRVRTFAINAGTAASESISTTYIGLRTAGFF